MPAVAAESFVSRISLHSLLLSEDSCDYWAKLVCETIWCFGAAWLLWRI